MNLLAVSSLFPNKNEPSRGVFNLRQFECLSLRFDMKVIAPLPYFPGQRLFPNHASFGRAAREAFEERHAGMTVYRPRYWTFPKIGRMLAGTSYYVSVSPLVYRMHARFPLEAIYVTWAYPDAWAVARMARRLGVPFVARVHGNDIHKADLGSPRARKIAEGLNAAHRVVSVSRSLKDKMIAFGVEPDRIDVVYNGVDKDVFRAMDREAARASLGFAGGERHVLSVGHLIPRKDPLGLLEAVRRLCAEGRAVRAHFVGVGPLRRDMERFIERHDLGARVALEGERPHAKIATLMNACDVLCLPSTSEGTPNVVLEALSCGLPVVATAVDGTPEIIESEALGLLVPPGDAAALAGALGRALDGAWDREAIAAHAMQFSWDANAARVERHILDAVAARGRQPV